MTINELTYLIYGMHYVSLDAINAFSESKPNTYITSLSTSCQNEQKTKKGDNYSLLVWQTKILLTGQPFLEPNKIERICFCACV